MKADAADTERTRSLELLLQPAGGAHPLLVVGSRDAENVRRMNDHVLRLDLRLGQCRPKALYALRLYRNLVAVVFRDGGKALHRGHSRITRALHRHVKTPVVDRVRTEVAGHRRLLLSELQAGRNDYHRSRATVELIPRDSMIARFDEGSQAGERNGRAASNGQAPESMNTRIDEGAARIADAHRVVVEPVTSRTAEQIRRNRIVTRICRRIRSQVQQSSDRSERDGGIRRDCAARFNELLLCELHVGPVDSQIEWAVEPDLAKSAGVPACANFIVECAAPKRHTSEHAGRRPLTESRLGGRL